MAKYVKLVQMKPIQGLFWEYKKRLLKICPMDAESGIPLTQYLTDPLNKEVPALLL
jgi:hypothetical protein